MGLLVTLRSLADVLSPKAADLIGELMEQTRQEWRTDMIASANEKVSERAADLHRKIHEDLAAVELRFTRDVNEKFEALRNEINEKFTALRNEINEKFGAVERRFTEVNDRIAATETRLITWFVGLSIIQFGMLIALAWAQKHLF